MKTYSVIANGSTTINNKILYKIKNTYSMTYPLCKINNETFKYFQVGAVDVCEMKMVGEQNSNSINEYKVQEMKLIRKLAESDMEKFTINISDIPQEEISSIIESQPQLKSLFSKQ